MLDVHVVAAGHVVAAAVPQVLTGLAALVQAVGVLVWALRRRS